MFISVMPSQGEEHVKLFKIFSLSSLLLSDMTEFKFNMRVCLNSAFEEWPSSHPTAIPI